MFQPKLQSPHDIFCKGHFGQAENFSAPFYICKKRFRQKFLEEIPFYALVCEKPLKTSMKYFLNSGRSWHPFHPTFFFLSRNTSYCHLLSFSAPSLSIYLFIYLVCLQPVPLLYHLPFRPCMSHLLWHSSHFFLSTTFSFLYPLVRLFLYVCSLDLPSFPTPRSSQPLLPLLLFFRGALTISTSFGPYRCCHRRILACCLLF